MSHLGRPHPVGADIVSWTGAAGATAHICAVYACQGGRMSGRTSRSCMYVSLCVCNTQVTAWMVLDVHI